MSAESASKPARSPTTPQCWNPAAWLHDIGYASQLVDTGFHPLDGARYLRRTGVNERIAALVAHHTCALLEATERGPADVLSAEFPREQSPVSDLLWYCDLTVGPQGQPLTVEQRFEEIFGRYGPDHVVTRSITRAQPDLLAAAGRARSWSTRWRIKGWIARARDWCRSRPLGDLDHNIRRVSSRTRLSLEACAEQGTS